MSNKYQPLYLKHRPQSLNELVGQQSVVQTLKNAINNDRIAHAYLFTGPRGTGKTSSARILAKSINCHEGPTTEPCLKCASCIEVKESNSTSVFEIDAASNNSVEDARTIIERAPLVAQGGRNKFYIVDECHMLTKEAFNALLKTIEEPPPNVIFILATTEENKVPPTIVSRCQRLMFRLVHHDDLLAHLRAVAEKESIEIQNDALELIARKAAGGLRDALGLLDQASLLSKPGEPVTQSDLLILMGALHEDVLLSLSQAVIERNGRQIVESANKLLAEGREPSLIAMELAKHFLNLAKASYFASDNTGNSEGLNEFILGTDSYVEKLIDQSKEFERAELAQIVEQLDRLESSLKRSTSPSLTLEMGLLSICHRHEIQSLQEMSARLEKLERALADGNFQSTPSRTQPSQMAPQSSQRRSSHGDTQEQPRSASAPAAPREAARNERNEGSTHNYAAHDREERPSNPPRERAPEYNDTSALKESHLEANSREEESRPGSRPSDSARQERDESTAGPRQEEPPRREEPRPEREPEPRQVHSRDEGREEDTSQSGPRKTVGELEEIWSELLDEIHKRSIPAFSLVSSHAFPVSIDSGTLTLGVRKEFFQKSIENKAAIIEKAYLDVTGEELRVLVKVFADDMPEPKGGVRSLPSRDPIAPKSGGQGRPEPQYADERTGNESRFADSPRESARSGSEPSSSGDRGSSREGPSTGRNSYPSREEPAESDRGKFQSRSDNGSAQQSRSMPGRPEPSYGESSQARPQGRDSRQNDNTGESNGRKGIPAPSPGEVGESSLIKEAYSLFEGPGSRLIG